MQLGHPAAFVLGNAIAPAWAKISPRRAYGLIYWSLLEFFSLLSASATRTLHIRERSKIKMADHLINYSIFGVKYDGAFDFSINRALDVQQPIKFSAKT